MTTSAHATKIKLALKNAPNPLTIDEICMIVFGRKSGRERNIVRVNLHRFDCKKILVKYPQRYALELIEHPERYTIEDRKPKEKIE
jgi:hypothetical protein